LVALTTAFFAAVSIVLGRKLKTIETSVIMFNHMAIGTLMAYILVLIEDPYRKLFVYELGSTYILLIVAAVANFFAVNMWTYSTQYCKSTSVGVLRYVSILYNFLVDITVYDERFTTFQIVGAITILFANISVIVYKINQERDYKVNQEKDAYLEEKKLIKEVELSEIKIDK
jgi:drug/metabolite transporter (DMT)-like permease